MRLLNNYPILSFTFQEETSTNQNEEVLQLKAENKLLKTQVEHLTNQNEEVLQLKTENKLLKTQVEQLIKENDEQKQQLTDIRSNVCRI